jgi:hypothetical protein
MGAIFLSYASEDATRLDPLIALLEKAGTVWWDRRISPGSRWDSTIEQAMEEAHCVVVIWTRASVESRWVREEANEGLARGVLVPVILDDVRPPLGFRQFEAAVLHGWDGSPDHPEAQMLLQSVNQILSGAASAPRQGAKTSPDRPAPSPRPAPPAGRSGRRGWPAGKLAAAAVVVLAFGGYLSGIFTSDAEPTSLPAASYFLDGVFAGASPSAWYAEAGCEQETLQYTGPDPAEAVTFRFINQSSHVAEIAWLSPEGWTEPSEGFPPAWDLEPGDSVSLSTYVGHFWKATVGDRCRLYAPVADGVDVSLEDE